MPDMTPQDYARGCLLRVVAQPGRYDQGTWQTALPEELSTSFRGRYAEVSCPTTGCVAGTAAMLAGDVGLAREHRLINVNGQERYTISNVRTANGKTVEIRERGRQLLGLDEQQASWLFSGERKLPEVVQALIELSSGEQLSYRMERSMSDAEKHALKNYRVPSPTKRKSVAAAPNAPTPVKAKHRM